MSVLVRLGRRFEADPLRDGFLFHRDNSSACFNTRQTLTGLTAATSASSIMNVGRR